jgi:prepilin-type N-terminal cleavage/methylation domain-containing protein
MPRRANNSRQPQEGFSLIEIIIAMAVMVEVLVVVLILFDANNKLTNVQLQVADLQQSQRIAQHDMVRMTRMAGRGGIRQPWAIPWDPAGASPPYFQGGPDNSGRRILPSDSDSPEVVDGTDILTVRGVFTTPIYQLNTRGAGAFTLEPAGCGPSAAQCTGGTLLISAKSPAQIDQDLQALQDAATTPREALIMVSPVDDAIHGVVEITSVTIAADAEGINVATVTFTLQGEHKEEYYGISAQGDTNGDFFPDALANVAFAGILEEYRYYIRNEFVVSGNPQSDAAPTLSRARVYPGTQVAWQDAGNLRVDVADNIGDFQVALGIDTDGNEIISDGAVDGTDLSTDEWLFNDSADTPDSFAGSRVFYVRLTTMARTARPDTTYQADPLDQIENRDYQPSDPANEQYARQHRRRLLRTVVDMRNVG